MASNYYYEGPVGSETGASVKLPSYAPFLNDEAKRRISRALNPKLEEDLHKQAFEKRLERWDTESTKFRDQLTQGFRTASEYGAARQMGGVQAAMGQYLQRQGLEGGIAASLTQNTVAQFMGQVAQTNMDFRSRLDQLLYAERQGFLAGEFDFMRRLEAMSYGQELAKDMARFQSQLQSNLESKSRFTNFLGTLGTVIGMAAFSPVSAPVYGATEFAERRM